MNVKSLNDDERRELERLRNREVDHEEEMAKAISKALDQERIACAEIAKTSYSVYVASKRILDRIEAKKDGSTNNR